MTILLISALLSLLTLLLCLPRQLHMLQQNSYFIARYIKWLKSAVTPAGWLLAVFTLVQLVLVFTRPLYDIPLLCTVILAGAVRINLTSKKLRTAIKKLVWTARVRRMMATAVVLLVLLSLCLFLFDETDLFRSDAAAEIYTTVCILLSACVPAYAIVVSLVNKPVEKAVASHYVRDAARILKQYDQMKIIGITGSYGKTSTKYILGRILSEKYNVLITPESYNTLMGVVRTVREHLKSGTQIFVVEMGAKKPKDIAEICDLVHPDMGIITSIGPQHLDTFKTIENIISTKFELSDAVRKNGGTVYLNHDNEYIRKHAEEKGAVFFGTGLSCAYRAEEISYSRNGSSFTICSDKGRIPVTTKLLSTHNVLNILAAASVALDLGVLPADLQYAVKNLKPVEHRLEMKPFLNGAVLIDDAYNANPSGSLESVRVLGSFEGMRKIIVTPGLVELGEKEYEHNYNLGLAAGETCDVIILVGEKRSIPMQDAIRTLPFDRENLHVVKSFQDAMKILGSITDKNTVVLFENDLPDNYLK